jgi:toxin CcdB
MARFDVYAHPDPGLRTRTPFLLDVQNSYIDPLESRVVIPLRDATLFRVRMRDLNPMFEIAGKAVVLDSAAIAAFPAGELRRPVTDLVAQRDEIVAAMDTLFGGF